MPLEPLANIRCARGRGRHLGDTGLQLQDRRIQIWQMLGIPGKSRTGQKIGRGTRAKERRDIGSFAVSKTVFSGGCGKRIWRW